FGRSSLSTMARVSSIRSADSGDGIRRSAGMAPPLARLIPMTVLRSQLEYSLWMTTDLRTARGSARRAEVLEGLVELFLAEGFMAFSLDDLAARLQCSKPTLYGVAPSKEQLITAVVRSFFRGATTRVDERADA